MFGCDIMASLYTALAAFIGFFVRSQCLKIGINPYMAIVLSSFTATVIAYFTHFCRLQILHGTLCWHVLFLSFRVCLWSML